MYILSPADRFINLVNKTNVFEKKQEGIDSIVQDLNVLNLYCLNSSILTTGEIHASNDL